MKSIFVSFLFFGFVVITTTMHGQTPNFRSRSELGVFAGGSYYIGDLNRSDQFKNTKPAMGLLFRYNKNGRLTYRVSALYGSLSADDSKSRNALLRNRNLNFKSDIYELTGGLEFHYFPFRKGHDKYKATAYLLVELGVFQMNPMSSYNGRDIELRTLGTEGQGTSLTKRSNYSKTQLVLPLGFGAKFTLSERAAFNIEFGIRKTFTDFLDDVHANNYVDAVVLSGENGPLSASLSNRSLDQDPYGYRGNAKTKDWYVMFGAMLTFRLGPPDRCAHAD